MKSIVTLLFGLLSIYGLSQSEVYSVEKTQLADNYVLVTITGPVDNYATYLCKGNVDEVNTAVFKDGDILINQNNRDNFEENIDLGLLPSDIEYFNKNSENMLVYGGNKLKILDGDTHANIIKEFEIDTKVSIHNMAFMPISPRRIQITKNSIMDGHTERYFIICAGEGGGLTVIESEQENVFTFFQDFYDDDVDDKHLLSSSVHHYCDTSFFWVLNYWDGTCKVKKYFWNKNLDKYSFDKELILVNDEIIELQTRLTPGPLRLALLDKVIEINPITLNEINTYEGLRVDKFEHIFAHIRDEHGIYNFVTEEADYNDDIITMATSGDYDWENNRAYFTGYCDKELEPDFRVINYNADDPNNPIFQYFSLDGAMDVKAISLPEDVERIIAVGDNQIMGFDDAGDDICSHDLDCHYGYRIALDANPGPSPIDRIGISVACLIDGLLVQREEYSCSSLPDVKIVETGISSSLTCFNENDEEAYFFYNGEGGSNIYAKYDGTETSFIDIGLDKSVSALDCIYNKGSDLILASLHSHCDDYINLLEINNGNPVVSEEFYGDVCHFTNYDKYIYYYTESGYLSYRIHKVWMDNSMINNQFIPVSYAVNALEINKDDHLIYGTCVLESQEGKVVKIDHNEFNVIEYLPIEKNDPVDISYLSGLDKIYIAQYTYGIIEVYNTDFEYLSDIEINGHPNTIEYNPYQKQAYIMSEDADEPGFTRIAIINCISDQVVKEELIRRSDGFIYDTINDQLYMHTNCPYTNDNGEFEYNIKVLNGFNDEFSNQVNMNLYTYSDIFLSKDRMVPSKPSYDYTNNYIYVGNYGSATASKIKAFDESLNFKVVNGVGWKWISFPRMERYKDETFPTIPLLERLEPWTTITPEILYMEYKPEETDLSISYTNNFGWQTDPTLVNLQSTQGYKLKYEGETDIASIRLEGAKEDYDASINFVVGENWLGYFLDESYDPEQCLPPELWDVLYQIKTQYWSLTIVPPFSILKGKKTPFKYGDLVVLKTHAPYEDFQWQIAGDGEEDMELPQTSYYTFEEQADYIPFYVETDSTSEIQEIAVLVDGEVKGAAVREPGDTLVEVNGYLEGVDPGAVIEFETWNGYKSSPVAKEGYVVIDHQQKVREKRNIYVGEKASYYHVSLKSNEVFELPPDITMVSCKPNPFKQDIEFSFRLNYESDISLEIYDISGSLVKTIIKGAYPEGYYNFTWQGDNDSGNRINPGVYFYRASTGTGTVFTDKLILIK